MKLISLKVKKKIVNIFFNKTVNLFKGFNIDIYTMKSLSWRRLYKLMKLSVKYSDVNINKRDLKELAKFLTSVNLDLESKSNVKEIYSFLNKKDIYEFIEQMIMNISLILSALINFKHISHTETKEVYDYNFIREGILRI